MKRNLCYAFLILTFFSCKKNSDRGSQLERSLELAGKNREQLEKVLKHYSRPQDSLKWKATAFLIENMFIHYGNYGKGVEQYNTLFDILDTLNHKQTEPVSSRSKQIFDSVSANYNFSNYSRVPDNRRITAQFLINNIEFAFRAWKEMPWCKNIDFSTFCEYILPYRVRSEKIECWRPKFYTDYTEMAFKCTQTNDLAGVYSFMKSNIESYFKMDNQLESYYPFEQSVYDMTKGRTGSCSDLCAYSAAAMRAAGLPVAVDFIPYWGNLPNRHTLIHLMIKNSSSRRITNKNLFVNTGDIIDVSMDYNAAGKVFQANELPCGLYVQYNKTVPKVYRNTFSIQPEMEQMMASVDSSDIVSDFNKLNIKDVSDEYLACSNVTIRLNRKVQKHQLAYLCVFSINGWNPVAFAKINANGSITFNKMGKNIVYLPAIYENSNFVPVQRPFYIDSINNIKYIIPTISKKQEVKLIRKYPLFAYTANHPLKLKGGRFEGSNSPDFTGAQLFYEINYFPFYMNQKLITCPKTFRYLRYVSPQGSGGNIAEIEFYGMKGRDTILLKGNVLGDDGSAGHEPIKAFDHNMDTYYENIVNDGWVGTDLGVNNPKRVVKIRFCPRNDTNCIIPGSTYELFYWDDAWLSLGTQTAKNNFLIYTNAPTGALFWLKCHDGGKEERFFTYVNDMQIWW